MSRVTRINLHIGQYLLNNVLNSVDSEKHGVVMELTDVGVHIRGKGTNKLIPFSNIQGIDLEETASKSSKS